MKNHLNEKESRNFFEDPSVDEERENELSEGVKDTSIIEDRYSSVWGQRGYCPICKGYDRSILIYGGIVSVCETHKLMWYTDLWSLSIDELLDATKNKVDFYDYKLIDQFNFVQEGPTVTNREVLVRFISETTGKSEEIVNDVLDNHLRHFIPAKNMLDEPAHPDFLTELMDGKTDILGKVLFGDAPYKR